MLQLTAVNEHGLMFHHNRALCDSGLWRQSVATAAYRALETETTVR